MDNWLNTSFESSSSTTPEFSEFARQFKKDLQARLNSRLELVEFNRGHFYVSGFIRNKATTKLAYFSISDVRYFPDDWYYNLLVRTANHEKDYTGGINHFVAYPSLVDTVTALTE